MIIELSMGQFTVFENILASYGGSGLFTVDRGEDVVFFITIGSMITCDRVITCYLPTIG